MVIVRADGRQLAELAQAETCRHEPRTPGRRAAAALWTALVTTDSVAAARRALAGFAAPEVRAAALELLGHLTAEDVLPGKPAPEAAPNRRKTAP